MSTKINLTAILTDHVATLYNAKTGKLSIVDVAIFFVLPALCGVVAALAKIVLTTNAIGILVGSLSVLAGFLINVLVLLYTVKEVGPTDTEIVEQKTVIKEVNANLLFAICNAILTIVILCAVRIVPNFIVHILEGMIVFLIGNFILTLLMTLKRLRLLLSLRFK